ncbi:MAG: gliding motility protein GldN [Bacteroidetes bacterium]|nr:gliding motility protein GldN [Bacteroidota bacterium]
MKIFLRYTLLACFVVIGFVGEATAQVATSVNPSGFSTRQYAMDTVYSAKRIREDDKMFQISVWRRIDLREKYNISLYGSGDTKENGIINHIYKGVKQNALEIFADENFTQPLSIAQFDSSFWKTDFQDSIFVKQLFFLDFKEDFVFDRHHSQFKFDIKYIQLVMPAETNADPNSGVGFQKTIGFIRYKDFIIHFAKHPDARWINFQNISKSLSYKEAFESRLFRSVVTRYTNQSEALVIDLVDKNTPIDRRKMQAYLDALAFEYKLLDFENSVWEW